MYYPPAICALCSSSSKVDSVSSGIDEGKESSTKALLTANISSKEAKLFEDSEKAVDTTK